MSGAIEVGTAITDLINQRKVFHSEADFQFALAWQIQQLHQDADVRLEVPVTRASGGRTELDIQVQRGDPIEVTAIELKYRTALWAGTSEGEDFNLRYHSATDLGFLYFARDIQRVEELIGQGSADHGYAIFLTNEQRYTRHLARKCNFTDFQLENGGLLGPILNWAGDPNHKNSLNLKSSYAIKWVPFSTITAANGTATQFSVLMVKVG